jgi:hypothetical protein
MVDSKMKLIFKDQMSYAKLGTAMYQVQEARLAMHCESIFANAT